MSEHLSSEIIVLNGDVILTDVDLAKMVDEVPESGAVMVLRPHEQDAIHRYGIVARMKRFGSRTSKMAVAAPGATRWDSHFTGIRIEKIGAGPCSRWIWVHCSYGVHRVGADAEDFGDASRGDLA